MSCGELVARAEAEGGICVRLSLPVGGAAPAASDGAAVEEEAPAPLVEGFPGCAATLEDMFDVAQEFMTVRGASRRLGRRPASFLCTWEASISRHFR